MNTYIALFRGINVGGNNPLPMKGLVTLLEQLGLKEVRTYIQSGNVVFDTARAEPNAVAGDIRQAIAARYGFAPQVLILEARELEQAMAGNPYPEGDADPKSVHLTFLDAVPSHPDLETLAALRKSSERFTLQDKVFYLHAPEGIGRSKLAARVEKCLGVPGTARNWRSVCRIAELARQGR